MNTNKMEKLYDDISIQLNKMIPEQWERILMYAEIDEYSSTVFFYYISLKDKSPIYSLDIPELFNIDENEFEEEADNLEEYIQELLDEFIINKQKPWTNLTFKLDISGKFDIQYDYSNLENTNPYKNHIIWVYKNLGLCRDKKIIEEYLNNK